MPNKNIEDIMEKVDKKLNEITNFIFSKSQENLVKPMPPQERIISDTGFLMRSGSVNLSDKFKKSITYDAPYALSIEYGSPPHRMSGNMLVNWVRRKLGISDKEAINVAWMIAKKIQREGTEPHPFVRPAINEAMLRYNLKKKG